MIWWDFRQRRVPLFLTRHDPLCLIPEVCAGPGEVTACCAEGLPVGTVPAAEEGRLGNAWAGGKPPPLLGQCCLLRPGWFGRESLWKHPAELCLLPAVQGRGVSALDFLASSFPPGYSCAPSCPIGLSICDIFAQTKGKIRPFSQKTDPF